MSCDLRQKPLKMTLLYDVSLTVRKDVDDGQKIAINDDILRLEMSEQAILKILLSEDAVSRLEPDAAPHDSS